MSEFNFAAYAKAIHAGAPSLDPTNTVKKILDSIVMQDGVFNEKGSLYNITSKEALAWWNEKANIPPKIIDATKDGKIVRGVHKYFENTIYQETILPQREANTFSLIKHAIDNDDSIPYETLEEWQELLDNNQKAQYLAETFLYAISSSNDRNKENKTRKIKSSEIREDVDDFQRTLGKLPKPTQIDPPENLADHEMVYVSQLCAAYSDDAGEKITREELPAHPEYNKHFQRQRKDYYRAESVRQASRDLFSAEETDPFEDLKDETYSMIEETIEEVESEPALKKVKKVIDVAGKAPINRSLLAHIPRWIGAEEKKGTCHMLVNEERIKWVDDDEPTV